MLLCNRTISIRNRERLIEAIERARRSWLTYAPYLDLFGAELRRTPGVPSDQIPDDLITMNSRFSISDPELDDERFYTLVYPEHEAPHGGHLSALSPMGMALLGARVGEEVCWHSSEGPEVATVRRLFYQPEAAMRQRMVMS